MSKAKPATLDPQTEIVADRQIVGWLVYTHDQDFEFRYFSERNEAEVCAAEVAERRGKDEWDIYPLHRGKYISIQAFG